MTMRRLAWIAEGRRRDEWDRFSCLLSLIYSVNRSKKDKKLTPDDFNPYARPKKKKPQLLMSIRDLRGVFFPGTDPKPLEPGQLVGGGKTPASPTLVGLKQI